MALETQVRQLGDTRIAIAGTLTRPDGTVVDVTSLTVKFAMYDSEGVVKIAETSNNVSKTDATAGEVEYSPQDIDVDTPGIFFAYFIAETGGGAQDTFPAERGDFRIDIQRPAYTE